MAVKMVYMFVLLQSMMWSFGINKNIPVINLTSENYNNVFYVSSNVGVIYDYIQNKQMLLQGHV